MKISFNNIQEKVQVLRKKHVLKDNEVYKRVYLKSSKSRAERLIEMNARALLRQLPNKDNFRVDAYGRIRPRTYDRDNRQDNTPHFA